MATTWPVGHDSEIPLPLLTDNLHLRSRQEDPGRRVQQRARARELRDTIPGVDPNFVEEHGMRAEPKTYVWFFDTFSAVLGPLNEATMHAHPVAQLTVGLDVPLHIHSVAGPVDGWAVFVPPGTNHRSDPSTGACATLYLDPFHTLSRAMTHRARHHLMSLDVPPEQRAALADLSPGPTSCIEARTRFEALLSCQDDPPGPALDPRVAHALRLLRSDDGKLITLAALAEAVGLSTERLRHLLRAQVGLPFSRYRRWLRLGDAVEAILNGASFTDAAHSSAFTDSAHLAHTFRQAFGDSLSGRLLDPQGSRFIQAVRCRDS
ncbi:helix-turn-helix domain-containing protein [Nocardia gipuzkoensis]